MTAQPQARVRFDAPPARPASSPPNRDVKLPRRPRRWGQWAGTVLFVIGSLLAAVWLWQQQGAQVEVLVVDQAVPAGHVVERDDLRSASVSGVDGAIAVEQADNVIGSIAAVGLVPGQVLTQSLLTSEVVPGPGRRVVGVELDATRTPLGLDAGDVVAVLGVPATGDAGDPVALDSPTVLAAMADVFQVDHVDGGGTRISLVVPDAEANRVAAYGAAGRIALVQAPLGTGR